MLRLLQHIHLHYQQVYAIGVCFFLVVTFLVRFTIFVGLSQELKTRSYVRLPDPGICSEHCGVLSTQRSLVLYVQPGWVLYYG